MDLKGERMRLVGCALVICIGCGSNDPLGLREEKDEFRQHVAELGDRIEDLDPGASSTKDLGTVDGNYGYVIAYDAVEGEQVGAGTLEVCVTSNGSTAVTYFPHFSPGFGFVDTAPGCTEVTNADPALENDLLVELSGTGTATVTTQLLP
jgi:hypothetical protein